VPLPTLPVPTVMNLIGEGLDNGAKDEE